MKTVGIRELKDRLSEYVRAVRAGDEVLVTDRGEIVAELTPPGNARSGLPAGIAALARAGKLTPGGENRASLYPKLPRLLKRGRAAELLDDERGTS